MTEAPKQQETFMQKYFWGLAVLFVVVVAAVIGLGFVLVGNSTQDLKTELNDNYVEQIDIRSVPAGGGRSESLFVIDGTSRYDCSEADGKLVCDDDPQPTPQD